MNLNLDTVAARPAAMRRISQALLVLFAAAIGLAIQLKYIPIVGMGQGFESVSLAKSLALHGTFADPFNGPTGPTAHLAPLYPLVLAAIRRMSPDEPSYQANALGLTLLLHVVQALLLFLIARELFPHGLTQLFTVALVVALPLYQVIPAFETMCVSCGILAFWPLVRRRKVVLAGILGGLLLLFNPSLLLVQLALVICEWKQVKPIGIFLAIACLVILPWEVRNYRTFHKLFFIRDNLGLELDVYNNNCEAYGAGLCFPHPTLSTAERLTIRNMGEANYNQMRLGRAFTWLATHPGGAAKLAARRAAGFWFPFPFVPPYGYCITALTLASFWGFWCLLRNRHPAAMPFLAISAVYPLVYYLVAFDVRYRYPILWISLLAAAYGIARWKRPAPGHLTAG